MSPFTNVNLQVIRFLRIPLCISNCLINISTKTSSATFFLFIYFFNWRKIALRCCVGFCHRCTTESSAILNLSHLKTELLTFPTLIFQGLPSHFWKVCPCTGSGFSQGHSLESRAVCALKYEKLTSSHHLHGPTQLQVAITSDLG